MGPKSLIALLFLLLNAQVFSRPPHERATIQDQIMDYNQYGKISAAMLGLLDSEIAMTRDFFESEKANLGEPHSHTEGKIRATLISIINSGLVDVQQSRAELDDISDLTDADLEPIKNKLRSLNISIEELKI